MLKLEGKVAVVTGASRGIGKGIARVFAREGCRVVLCARDTHNLNRVAEEIESNGGIAVAVPTDLREEAQIRALFDKTVERFQRVDLLVNNAGAFDGGPIDQLTREAWDNVVAVNLTAPFLCTREAFRIMKRQRGGRIINVASIAAQRVRPHSAPYSATKHGLWGLTQVTALEGREYGIVCSCLLPGNVSIERRTDSGRSEDAEPMMTVQEIAEAALFMASQPPHVNVLEAVVMPTQQLFIGRG